MKRLSVATAGALIAIIATAVTHGAPAPAPAFVGKVSITPATPVNDIGFATQMAWGPDQRLYVARAEQEIFSYAYNPVTHQLTDRRGTGISGMGIAFATHPVPGSKTHQNFMYVSRRGTPFEGTLSRYTDSNADFTWGQAGETNVDLVRGVPLGDHSMNQIQITGGNTLYVGIGVRSQNGRLTAGSFHDEPSGPVPGGVFDGLPGDTYGETSYNGAIAWIQNLSAIPSTTSAAQLRKGPNGTSGALMAGRDDFLFGAPFATLPYTSTAPDKLTVHSAGTRNPFGIAKDFAGNPWFTNNFGRADTRGNGTSDPHFHDLLDSDLSNDVGDQLFRVTDDGDYRYDNYYFREAEEFPDTPVRSTTFDNLDSDRPGFNVLHDPDNPNGLGPSSSANGFDFVKMNFTSALPSRAREYAVISRWSDFIPETSPGTDVLEYRDIVFVDPTTGDTVQAITGFNNPIDVLRDPFGGGFLVADFGVTGTIYHVTVPGRMPSHGHVPVAPEPACAAIVGLVAFCGLRRRRG
jgi:hypothetical protein